MKQRPFPPLPTIGRESPPISMNAGSMAFPLVGSNVLSSSNGESNSHCPVPRSFWYGIGHHTKGSQDSLHSGAFPFSSPSKGTQSPPCLAFRKKAPSPSGDSSTYARFSSGFFPLTFHVRIFIFFLFFSPISSREPARPTRAPSPGDLNDVISLPSPPFPLVFTFHLNDFSPS